MVALPDWIQNPFSSSPTFERFALVAQNTGEHERIVYRNGVLTNVSKNEDLNVNERRRTWKAFTSAVEGVFSPRKIQEICKRYNNIKWEELKTSTAPFDKLYILCFGVGAGCVHVNDLQQALDEETTWFRRGFEKCSSEVLKKYYEKASAFQYLGATKDPKIINGAPQAQHESVAQDTLSRDQQRCNLIRASRDLVSDDPNIPPLHPFYSRLEMGVICLLDINDKGMVIPAPGGDYQVYDVISSKGLTAFALKPVSKCSSQKSIVAFRCTNQAIPQTNAIHSFLNNWEEENGKTGYEACKEKLAALMEDNVFTNGKKPVVLGYSLGGGHASYFFREFWKKISELVLFNAVGINAKVVEDVASEINALPDGAVPPAIYSHRNVCNKEGTIGDWVNKIGEKHMGWGIHHPLARVNVYEWLLENYPPPGQNLFNFQDVTRSFNMHAIRPMDCIEDHEYTLHQGPTACDPILDTCNRDRSLEDARQRFGRMYFQIISEIYQLINFIFRILGIEFFKEHG